MRFALNGSLIFIVSLFLFQSSNGSELISKNCKEASNRDPRIMYDFCVACLEEASSKLHPPPTNLEDLLGILITISKNNATNVLSIISELSKDKSLDKFALLTLQECSGLYDQGVFYLDNVAGNLKSKVFNNVDMDLSGIRTFSLVCNEDLSSKWRGGISPLSKEYQIFDQLLGISYVFLKIITKT
ncbi:hypothetical protein VIGAN_11058100 [Vigna angularis var. angularis]|uniref:Pectinesterase inhibitor domain-containing protein n=1 Tax=Vigna angularis var. angularis TaxID=157739 RepID=A0A0S3T7Z4_PHAAN|nr:hypothetical protein VIGAN_11058100 [Vigna angularis var. angularis]